MITTQLFPKDLEVDKRDIEGFNNIVDILRENKCDKFLIREGIVSLTKKDTVEELLIKIFKNKGM